MQYFAPERTTLRSGSDVFPGAGPEWVVWDESRRSLSRLHESLQAGFKHPAIMAGTLTGHAINARGDVVLAHLHGSSMEMIIYRQKQN